MLCQTPRAKLQRANPSVGVSRAIRVRLLSHSLCQLGDEGFIRNLFASFVPLHLLLLFLLELGGNLHFAFFLPFPLPLEPFNPFADDVALGLLDEDAELLAC